MIARVTAHMAGPILADYDVHLDALVIWSAAKDLDLPPPQRSTPIEDLADVPVPITYVERDGIRVYRCSAWDLPAEAAPYRHHWCRRRDGGDVHWLRRAFNPAYGPGRDLMRRGHGWAVPRLSWLLESTDVDWLTRLLQRITHIGRLRSHGLGEIDRWEICPDDGDPFEVDGVITRALPATWADTDVPSVRLAVSPPYWHPARHIDAIAPGTPGTLRRDHEHR